MALGWRSPLSIYTLLDAQALAYVGCLPPAYVVDWDGRSLSHADLTVSWLLTWYENNCALVAKQAMILAIWFVGDYEMVWICSTISFSENEEQFVDCLTYVDSFFWQKHGGCRSWYVHFLRRCLMICKHRLNFGLWSSLQNGHTSSWDSKDMQNTQKNIWQTFAWIQIQDGFWIITGLTYPWGCPCVRLLESAFDFGSLYN